MEQARAGNDDFQLGIWRVQSGLGQISDGQRERRLEPRVMQVLTILIEANGQLVTRAELFDRVWPNQVISDQTLSSLISQLRRQLDDSPRSPVLIGTVPKKGYRLLQQVRPFTASNNAKVAPKAASSADQNPNPVSDARATSPPRRHRWLSWTLVAVLLGALAIWMLPPSPSPLEPAAPSVVLPGSVAVLPFADLSETANNVYFGDGMAEELLNQLANVPGLQVVSRTSSFQYRETERPADVRAIGADLNARHVIEGSVRRDGDQVRVTVQLIDAQSGYHSWSQAFDARWVDLVELQQSITAAVVDQIAPQLLEDYALNLNQPSSVAAYDLYLQGRHYWHQRNPAALAQAVELFNQAIALDPNYALAYAGLADCYLSQPRYGTLAAAESIALAKPLIDRALQLAPQLAEAHLVHGNWYALQTDWVQAETHLRRAVKLNPNSAMAQMSLGSVFNDSGQLARAYLSYHKAQQLNPLHPTIAMNLAQTAAKLGLNPSAQAHTEQARAIAPEHIYLFGLTGHVYLSAGDRDGIKRTLDAWLARQRGVDFVPEPAAVTDYVMCGILAQFLDRSALARQCLSSAVQAPVAILPPYQMQGLTHLALLEQQADRATDAQALARQALGVAEAAAQDHPQHELIVYEKAVAHVLLGQTEAALAELRRSIELGHRDLGRMVHDQRLAKLRPHPAYQDLIAQVRAGQARLRTQVQDQLQLDSPSAVSRS